MKAKPNQPKRSRKRSALLLLLAVLILGAAGAGLYKHHQKNQAIAKERAQYAQAEKNLDTLSAQIIAKLGQPDDQKKVKECGYTSDTFELSPHGDLFCNVGWNLTYDIQNLSDANSTAQQLEVLLPISDKSKLLSVDELNSEASQGPSTPFDLGSSSYKSNGLNCFRAYVVDSKLGTEIRDDSKYDYKLRIELNCSAAKPLAKYFNLVSP